MAIVSSALVAVHGLENGGGGGRQDALPGRPAQAVFCQIFATLKKSDAKKPAMARSMATSNLPYRARRTPLRLADISLINVVLLPFRFAGAIGLFCTRTLYDKEMLQAMRMSNGLGGRPDSASLLTAARSDVPPAEVTTDAAASSISSGSATSTASGFTSIDLQPAGGGGAPAPNPNPN